MYLYFKFPFAAYIDEIGVILWTQEMWVPWNYMLFLILYFSITKENGPNLSSWGLSGAQVS